MMKLERYSFGVGDRFGHQGRAQLQAMILAEQAGVVITPVWNKSHREHSIIHTAPASVRREADAAVKALGWKHTYHVDADHISLKNVDLFMEASDFFTLDVADFMGKPADPADVKAFVQKHKGLTGTLSIPGIAEPLSISESQIETIAKKVLLAVREAGQIYRTIESAKGKGNFITEVSMDETDLPQTPVEMLFILAAIADEGIPAQTIAPKFTGRFNKGVDYVGDVNQFAKEFEQDLAVIAFAVKEFHLPENLKLSVHSGSDKFSIYAPIHKALKRFHAGLHVKTAGTTWLEEVIGLASAGGEGLNIARTIYANALGRFEELCGPYAPVIHIDKSKQPAPGEVNTWSSQKFADTLRHIQSRPDSNANFRQWIHGGYKVAVELGAVYQNALQTYESVIAAGVTENIWQRHIKPIFLGY